MHKVNYAQNYKINFRLRTDFLKECHLKDMSAIKKGVILIKHQSPPNFKNIKPVTFYCRNLHIALCYKEVVV